MNELRFIVKRLVGALAVVVLCMGTLVLTSCDKPEEGQVISAPLGPVLAVKYKRLDPQSLEKMVSFFACDLEISYTGQANTAEITIDVFDDGAKVINKMSVGGFGGFPPDEKLHFNQRIMMLDSENSPMLLNPKYADDAPFYRFLNTASRIITIEHSGLVVSTTSGPGIHFIPKTVISFGDGHSSGDFSTHDLSLTHIPIVYIKNKAGGQVAAPMKEGKLALNTDDGAGYIIFYLTLHKDKDKG